MARLLRVDMTRLSVRSEPLSEKYRLLGGRALTSTIVADEVDPGADALGPSNELVFAPGLLSGTTVSSSNRLSVGCKSPLTGGIKESNAGGQSAMRLAQLEYRAIVVEGQPEDRRGLYLLLVDKTGGRLESADDLRGLSTQETANRLFERFGKKIGLSVIGPPGEMEMNLAGICNNDPEGRMGRINGRGGVGAVMGSKGLKAIVYTESEFAAPAWAAGDAWKAAVRDYHHDVRTQPSTNEMFPLYGTAVTLETVNKFGGLPIRNFSRGSDPRAASMGGIAMREAILARGGAGTPTHSCMTGCAIRCSNVWPDADGREVASSMEYETNTLLGVNLEIFDFDAVARLTRECNDLGIDTVETGGTLGIAMEAGLIPWGSENGVMRMLGEIRRGSLTGRILGTGGVLAAKVLSVRNVPAVKGQMMAAYDPRGIKGNGVTYATSPMGADHTAGNTIVVPTDHRDPSDKLELSRKLQFVTVVMDSMGLCNFARASWQAHPEHITALFNARTGSAATPDDLVGLGKQVLRAEIAFNRRAGLGPSSDRLPEYMRTTPLPPYGLVFDVPAEELEHAWDGLLQ